MQGFGAQSLEGNAGFCSSSSKCRGLQL
jgi:hypothetical protein